MGFLDRLRRRDDDQAPRSLPFSFEWHESYTEADDGEELDGRGYMLRDEHGNAISWEEQSLEHDGIWILRVAGVAHRREAIQDDACAPGMPVELRPNPRNQHDPNAVEIRTATGRQIGFVPSDRSGDVAERLRRERLDSYVLWEWRKPDGERCALRIVVGSRGALPPFPRA